MSKIVIYDKKTGNIIRYNKSAHTPDYINREDVIINPENLTNKIFLNDLNDPKTSIDLWKVDLETKELKLKSEDEIKKIREAKEEKDLIEAVSSQIKTGHSLLAKIRILADNNLNKNDKIQFYSSISDVISLLNVGDLESALHLISNLETTVKEIQKMYEESFALINNYIGK